jgi:hypothetical protein
MALLPGVPGNIALLEGPLLLGYLFSYGLQGILIVQMYIYYTNFPDDRVWLKRLVWMLFFIECLGTAFGTHAAWKAFAAGWGDLEALNKPVWSFAAFPPMCGFIALVVHSFFGWRIWVLGKTLIIPCLIVAVSLTQCVSAFYTGIQFAVIGDFRRIKLLTSYIVIWLGGSAACETIIAITMVTFLFRARNSAFRDTNSVLNRLITLTIETGMATALATLTEIALLVAFSHTNLHFLICIMLAKLYSNTLLATLNARALLRNPSQSSQQYIHAKKTLLWDDAPNPSPTPRSGRNYAHVSTRAESRGSTQSDIIFLEHGTNASSVWSSKADPATSKNAY